MPELDLKPCPFCGDNAGLDVFPEIKPHRCAGLWWKVRCSPCGAQIGYAEDEASAITLWNTRPSGGEAVAEPFCWVIPGDDTANMNGFIDARITREGEFTKPLYTAAPRRAATLCEDCPPEGYPTDKTRCEPCPRRVPLQGVVEALRQAGASFERIRKMLGKSLDEPERAAFWEAVRAGDGVRAALSAKAPAGGEEPDFETGEANFQKVRAAAANLGYDLIPSLGPEEQARADETHLQDALYGVAVRILGDQPLADRVSKAGVHALSAQAGGEDRSWFWKIVDAEGLADLPSDEENALRRLIQRAAPQAGETVAGDMVLVPREHATEAQIEEAKRRIKDVMLDGQEQPSEIMLHAAYVGFLASAPASQTECADALQDLVEIIDKAGLLNLSNGVQLGQTSWYVKASERLERARAVLSKGSPT